MAVNWKDHFDRIFCVHYLPAKHKEARLIDELDRVGIRKSGIFSMEFTVPSPYDKIIYEGQKDPVCCPSPVFVNICLEVRKILYIARQQHYRRILLLEDDVAFLKNEDELNRLLSLTPEGYGVVQYDKFVNPQFVNDYNRRLSLMSINENYFEGYGGVFTSAACIGLFNEGIDEMFRVLDTRICATDIAYQFVNCKYAVAKKHLAVQVMHKGSQSVDTVGIKYMDTVYKNAGVDFADYAVPDGYTYGCMLDEHGLVVKPPADLTKVPVK